MASVSTSFLCTLQWSWSPVNERRESYYLQRTPDHWILWLKQYDDNYEECGKPSAVARCLRDELGEDSKSAAMTLLAAVLKEGIRQFDSELDRFHEVIDTGLLCESDLDAIGDIVWGSQK
jgi:hypothetical protein